MKKQLVAVILSVIGLPASAATQLIPALNRVDMVHDDVRGLVYITQGSEILRFQPSTSSFLNPIVLSGQLSGIDISPDNKTLVVADRTGSQSHSWVHLVNLETLGHQTVQVATPDVYEGGTFTAVYDANGQIYTTSTFNGSGWVPLRRLNPATGEWTNLASVRQNTMLTASGDGLTIAFAEANSSGGPWGLVDVPTGGIVRRDGFSTGTNWFFYEVATDRFGAQFSIPAYAGTFVFDENYALISTIGDYAGAQPIGAAYHPVERIAYFPFAGTSEVRTYDMSTRMQIGSYNAGTAFTNVGNTAFRQGRTRLSRDGSVLLVGIEGGVRLFEQYASLSAAPVSATVQIGQARQISLAGSVGNNGALSYTVVTSPSQGTVSLNGNVATYTPRAGFVGADSFRYRVSYGRAVREANVSLSVIDPNRAPIAVNDTAATRHTRISIPVLANDSDPDGDSLRIVSTTPPNAGSVSIVDGTRLSFTPPNRWPGLITFTYTISDGRGKTATATVTVRRN